MAFTGFGEGNGEGQGEGQRRGLLVPPFDKEFRLIRPQKTLAEYDFSHQGLKLEVFLLGLFDNPVDREGVCGAEFLGEGKSQEVCSEGLGEAPLLHDQ